MTYLSIMEKLTILFNSLLDLEFVLVFAILLLFFTFLYIIKKLNAKKYVLFTFLSFTLVFGISIVNNYDILSNTFDNFTTIFFGNIYFPSIYVYIGILVVSFIVFITSMINVMLKKIYKVINSIMFIINNILCVVILNIIAKNKIDIFSVNSLYTNTSLVAILELSMGLCVIWILSLLVVYVTNAICDGMASKKVYNKVEDTEVFNPILEVSNDVVNDINFLNNEEGFVYENVLNTEEELKQNVSTIDEMEILNETTNNEQVDVVVNTGTTDVKEEKLSDVVTFNDILNGVIPVTYYDNDYVNEVYDLMNPQMVYENNYNKVKSEIVFNDLNIMLDDKEIKNNVIEDNNIIFDKINSKEDNLSIEELTQKEKEKVSEERLRLNTVSLNDLIDKDDFNVKVEVNKSIDNTNILEVKDKDENNSYSIDDYKKIVKMLNSLKNHSNNNNIKVDDAVAISLISNYSVDDCIKFKNILENNLN